MGKLSFLKSFKTAPPVRHLSRLNKLTKLTQADSSYPSIHVLSTHDNCRYTFGWPQYLNTSVPWRELLDSEYSKLDKTGQSWTELDKVGHRR